MVRKSMTALVNRLCIVPIAALLVLSASTGAPSLRVWSVRRQSWVRTDSGCEAEASLAVFLRFTATRFRGQLRAGRTSCRRPGMRLLIVTGILLAALGAFIVVKGLNIQSRGTVHIGPIQSTVHQQHTVPALFGWFAVVGSDDE